MSMTPTEPSPTHRRGSSTLVVWAIALGFVVIYHYTRSFLGPLKGVLGFIAFLSCLVFIAITLYWIALAIRWMLRALFWRVGRRLFLSYVLIGALPFFLIGVLLLTIGYMIAGVMSHAALRGERQATLGQMESAALEYGLTGHHPPDALSTLEIYDTANDSGKKLPDWLREATFSGMVWRGKSPLLVSSRQFEGGRTVVFVQPLDREWADQLEEKTGMITRARWDQEGDRDDDESDDSHAKSKSIIIRRTPGSPTATVELDDENAAEFGRMAWRSIGRKIVWADVSDLTDWDTGETRNDRQLVTLIVNPVSSLFQFYFGSSSGVYLRALLQGILAITVMLLIIYMFAAMFAVVLIFSISRAVNRIEKGTKAVERGDFSYRINMKPHNQLGEMAQSFDRMTESISTLLVTVAEKERLQSEIEIAASIQRNLLPKEGPQFRGVSFSAHFEPTASIGGDYYDVFNLDKSRLAVAIGDVSGHGLSTGLVMAMVKAAITTLVEEGADETSLFRRLNELVFRSTERRAFMTLAFTIFDLEHGTIRHTNAGHLYPYLLRDGQPAISIESPSLPLGVRSELLTQTVEVDLQEGDAIVYLSDGIVEAQNENGDPLGFDALESLLGSAPDRSPSVIRDAILTAVAHHCGTRPADDDRTVMILRFEQFRIPIRPVVAAAAVEDPVATI